MNEIKTMGGERMDRYISRIHQQIDYLTAHPEEDQKRDEAWRKICDIENDAKATAKYTAMVPRKYWGMPMNETSLIDHLPAHINAYEYKSVITQCLKAVNDSMDHKHRNIMLIGASGIGKTYYACWQINALMHMIWYFDNPFHEKNAGNNFPHYWSCEYITGKDLGARYKATDSYKSSTTKHEIASKYADCDFLVLDEIGRSMTNYEKEAIFDIVDEREKSTLFISNLPEEALSSWLGEACWNRIQWGIVKPVTAGCVSMREEETTDIHKPSVAQQTYNVYKMPENATAGDVIRQRAVAEKVYQTEMY